ncbi:MAG: DUF5681 domain-containing protein [Vitreimonas sp.]
MSRDSGDDVKVGYGKPPRSGQFKKGQSGCPSGGHEQRRARKATKAQKVASRERARLRELTNIVKTIALEERKVQTANGAVKMPILEILVRKVALRALEKDASEKDVRRALAMFDKANLLKPVIDTGRTGVLVVRPIMKQDEWLKATEGELLPRDPLHGIPGAEGLLLEQGQPPRKGPPE